MFNLISLLPLLLMGGGLLGGKGDKVMPEAVDPEMQQRMKDLFDFWWGKRDQQATPLPEDMPLTANWHPNITDSSNIWRAMAGMGGQPSWQGAGGTPFQYGGQLPAPMGDPRTAITPATRTGVRDPYDPRSLLSREVLSRGGGSRGGTGIQRV